MREADETTSNSAIDPITGQINQALLNNSRETPSEAGTPQTPSSTDTSQLNGDAKMENGDENSNSSTGPPPTATTNHENKSDSATSGTATEGGSKPVVLLSGFLKSELQELEKMAKEVGLELTSHPQNATHLIMPQLVRTISFLTAMSYVKFILKADWIRESHKEKKVLDISKYRLEDSGFERTFGCNLLKTLQKPDRHKLFEVSKSIFCTLFPN